MTVRLGEVLVRHGVLTTEQVEEILEEQRRTRRPFGLIAEQLYGVRESAIEQAWAEQYEELTGEFDLRTHRPRREALEVVSRRQAWQFTVLPVEFDGGDLVLVTTRENLPRALRFATRVLERPCFFALTDARSLGEALNEHYPMPGMSAENAFGRDEAVA